MAGDTGMDTQSTTADTGPVVVVVVVVVVADGGFGGFDRLGGGFRTAVAGSGPPPATAS